MDPVVLLQEFVRAPGPPGQEDAIRTCVGGYVDKLGRARRTDAKGNLIVNLGDKPRTVVTAHLDEIAMVVRTIEGGGSLRVGALGGLYPWKLGEGPVHILAPGGPLNGVLSFGSIHTEDAASTAVQAKQSAIDWDMAWVETGLSDGQLIGLGVRPGVRVVVHPDARGLTHLGSLVAGRFLDDRADLVAWLLALEMLADFDGDVDFVATASEETGGEGALYYLQEYRPEVCIALELGPNVPDAPAELTPAPTVWTSDGYAAMSAADGDLVTRVAAEAGIDIQYQGLSRGGSDASCAASHGLCARPITLGLAMENSHGYEIMHPEAMVNLAALTAALVRECTTNQLTK
ncbi:MAG: M20/M25/M40 family metallo-hydrolase [Fimbriimonadaceae bacterium]